MENRADMAVQNEQEVQNIAAAESNAEPSFAAADILARIDKIIAQGEALAAAAETVHTLPVNSAPNDGGFDGGSRAEAIGKIYSSREATNQKLIGLLERMYSDIAPKHEIDRRSEILETISRTNFQAVEPESVRTILDFYKKQLESL